MASNLRTSSSPSGTRNVWDLIRNIVTDYGADPTGVVSCVSDFYTDFKTEAAGKRALLTIPDGSIMNFAAFGGVSWINGCPKLQVQATGARLQGSLFLMTLHMTQIGIDQAGGKSARVKTINPGATTIELTTASASAGHISRFAVGRYIMVTGWDIQGEFQAAYGFPPNFQWVEFRKVTDITGNILTIDSPLTYFYDQNWIENHRGTQFEADGGGPATIFDLAAGWDADVVFNGGEYSAGGLINCCGRSFTINGGNSVGEPIFPSVNYYWKAVGHSAPDARCEIDKLVEVAEFTGGDWFRLQTQSSSCRLLKANGGAVLGNVDGTAKTTEFDNITITNGLKISPISYGKADTFTCTNSVVNGAITGGLLCKGPSDGIAQDLGYQGIITSMASGLITIPKCFGANIGRVFMPDPDGVLMWSGQFGKFGSFKVLSVTQDSWPATDDQQSTPTLTVGGNAKTVQSSTSIFSSGDVGKVIYIPAIMNNGGYSNCTLSNANPAVVTQTNHGKVAGDRFRFAAGSGVLPSGVTAGTWYYVLSTGLTTSTFRFSATDGGTAIDTTGGGGSGTVMASYFGGVYTSITGYVDSQNITIYHAVTAPVFTAARSIQWGTCNAYIQTDQPGGLPNGGLWSSIGTGLLSIYAPAGHSIRFENCTAPSSTAAQQATLADLCQSAAWDRPLWSYTKRTYDGTTGGAGAPAVAVLGKIISIKVNVTKAYTGAGTLNMGFSFFDNLRMNAVGGSGYTTYGPRFNMKNAGERVIQTGSTTGAQTGDTNLNISSDMWIDASYQVSMSRDISGESSSDWPSFTVEFILDQGF